VLSISGTFSLARKAEVWIDFAMLNSDGRTLQKWWFTSSQIHILDKRSDISYWLMKIAQWSGSSQKVPFWLRPVSSICSHQVNILYKDWNTWKFSLFHWKGINESLPFRVGLSFSYLSTSENSRFNQKGKKWKLPFRTEICLSQKDFISTPVYIPDHGDFDIQLIFGIQLESLRLCPTPWLQTLSQAESSAEPGCQIHLESIIFGA